MKVKRQWIIIGSVIALGVVVAIALSPREPRHEGTALSDWLIALDSPATQGLAKEAIQLIGTNALPAVIDELAASDPSWRHRFIVWSTNQSWMPLKFSVADQRRMRAVLACQALGPLARPAIPGLKAALHGHANTMGREAALALDAIGDEGDDVLMEAFSSTNRTVRYHAASAIMFPGYASPRATKPLFELIKSSDGDRNVNMVAQIAHGVSTLNPTNNIKHRLVELQSPQLFFRRQGAITLGKYGEAAAPMIPELEKALRDPEPVVRVEARNALIKIQEAMTKKQAK